MTIGEWDAGEILLSHQEFGGRVTQKDNPSYIDSHSTHVAGTIIAAGIDIYAKGMAYQANLDGYDWLNDISEMVSAASTGLLFSNHSYAQVVGWYFLSPNWIWFGDVQVSTTEDYRFGFYGPEAEEWDQIAVYAPYYLIVHAAGNERDYNSGPGIGEDYLFWNGFDWEISTLSRDEDCAPFGYDCIVPRANAKNTFTVGAIDDIPGGYSTSTDVVMSSFSGWGPTDDGRIKPDIVANGINVYSTTNTSNTGYTTMSGTSMAAPNVTGSLGLLQQHYQNTHGNKSMRAATLKALVIHTTDEAGESDGPDYEFGWGIMNSKSAAAVISGENVTSNIQEKILDNGTTYTINMYNNGSAPLKATLVWTDFLGTPTAPSLDPTTKMLVNDLDLRITGRTTYFPWVLNLMWLV
ncbi:MAG: S8 family serine peptidase [gamma proteobacterium symbiont of Lucinoma myriamae]|nr:S8 family serine peptidase [gamma proteobacterium symbiont of Lucinoma myriamae]